MNRNVLTILSLAFCFTIHAQTKFDSGYFVANDGRKITCLIKNFDWQFNPTEFLYKQTEKESARKADIAEVSEFGIINFSRYQRFDIGIDTSSQQTENLDGNPQPELKKMTVFLKVIVEGKATLYEYRVLNRILFFFKTDSTNLMPLVQKRYLSPDNQTDILENDLFRNQLFSALQSPGLDQNSFASLNYSEHGLTGVFRAYNKIRHSGSEDFAAKRSKTIFDLNLRIGAGLSNLIVENTNTPPAKMVFGNKAGATIGVEAEFFLPFNKNKWAAILQPSYRYYKSDLGASGSADYKAIETAIGVRDYFYLGKDSRLFATALAIFNSPVGSGAVVYSGGSLGYRFVGTGALSAGYKYRNNCSIELQYSLNRDILDYYEFWDSHFHSISLIFAYTVL